MNSADEVRYRALVQDLRKAGEASSSVGRRLEQEAADAIVALLEEVGRPAVPHSGERVAADAGGGKLRY